MKKILLIISICFSMLISNQLQAQTGCPGCVISAATCNPAGGGLCPDSLTAATVGDPYDEDVTVYFPPEVSTPIGLRPLLEVNVNSITGLPFGLNWQLNTNPYILGGAGGHGCAKICGTPFGVPGVYNVTINVTATVDAGILGTQTGDQTFNLQMVLLPGSASNAGFAMTPSSGCAPLVVHFDNNNPSGGYVSPNPSMYGGYVYTWDFGNGNTSTLENPTDQLYPSAGLYPVTYSVTIDTFGFRLREISILSANCTDFGSDQDLRYQLFNSSNIEISAGTGPSNTNATAGSPVTFTMNIPVTPSNWPFRVEVWDDDTWPSAPDDNCWDNADGGSFPAGTCALTLPPVNAYGITTQTFNSGTGLVFNYKFEKVVLTIPGADTIIVYPVPPSTSLSVSTNVTCTGDSIMLSTITGGYIYEWYLNDTTLLPDDSSTIYTTTAGNYKVKVIDPTSGCFTFMPDTTISFYPPVPPSFAIVYNFANGRLQSNTAATLNYQWQQFIGGVWVNISAPAGLQNFYLPDMNGQFRLVAVTPDGCSDTSNVYNYVTFGLESSDVSEFNIYPNPNDGNFTIQMDIANTENEIEVAIYNMIGQTVYSKNFEANNTSVLQQISLAGIAKGAYTMSVRVGNSTLHKKLIIE